MQCPYCGLVRYRADWSNTQWNVWRSTARGKDGWLRNCCRECSETSGWYYNRGTAPQPPPTGWAGQASTPPHPPSTSSSSSFSSDDVPNTSSSSSGSSDDPRIRFCGPLIVGAWDYCPLSRTELEQQLAGAEYWLRTNVPDKFFAMVEHLWNDTNLAYRDDLRRFNRKNGLSEKKHLMKLFSYWGAIRVPTWAVRLCSPGYPGFADPGNKCYAEFFRRVWPNSHICEYNDATVGDVVEALLGWHTYQVQVCATVFAVDVVNLITTIEQSVFASYALNFWYKEG